LRRKNKKWGRDKKPNKNNNKLFKEKRMREKTLLRKKYLGVVTPTKARRKPRISSEGKKELKKRKTGRTVRESKGSCGGRKLTKYLSDLRMGKRIRAKAQNKVQPERGNPWEKDPSCKKRYIFRLKLGQKSQRDKPT